MITKDGRFHPVIWPGRRELEERFRRRFLDHLRRAGRLSASFHETLLSWRHCGFSDDASQRVGAGEEARLERLARYATRVALAVGAVRERGDGRIEIDTAPDPTSGASVTVLDRLDFVHAVCQQIPDRGLHQKRYYGAYANEKRSVLRAAWSPEASEGAVRPTVVRCLDLRGRTALRAPRWYPSVPSARRQPPRSAITFPPRHARLRTGGGRSRPEARTGVWGGVDPETGFEAYPYVRVHATVSDASP